jgi:hypothetical protein
MMPPTKWVEASTWGNLEDKDPLEPGGLLQTTTRLFNGSGELRSRYYMVNLIH